MRAYFRSKCRLFFRMSILAILLGSFLAPPVFAFDLKRVGWAVLTSGASELLSATNDAVEDLTGFSLREKAGKIYNKIGSWGIFCKIQKKTGWSLPSLPPEWSENYGVSFYVDTNTLDKIISKARGTPSAPNEAGPYDTRPQYPTQENYVPEEDAGNCDLKSEVTESQSLSLAFEESGLHPEICEEAILEEASNGDADDYTKILSYCSARELSACEQNKKQTEQALTTVANWLWDAHVELSKLEREKSKTCTGPVATGSSGARQDEEPVPRFSDVLNRSLDQAEAQGGDCSALSDQDEVSDMSDEVYFPALLDCMADGLKECAEEKAALVKDLGNFLAELADVNHKSAETKKEIALCKLLTPHSAPRTKPANRISPSCKGKACRSIGL